MFTNLQAINIDLKMPIVRYSWSFTNLRGIKWNEFFQEYSDCGIVVQSFVNLGNKYREVHNGPLNKKIMRRSPKNAVLGQVF